MTLEQITEQLTVSEGSPRRTAIDHKTEAPNGDLILVAKRSGDQKKVAFRAVKQADNKAYEIHVYPERFGANFYQLMDPAGGAAAVPLEVMASNEEGGQKPMTGDYDLFAVCPS